jgi:selenide,water dikinase
LAQVLRRLPKVVHPNVLVGTTTSDDAAVYRLDARNALVGTVDFFTPIVDDPRDFGRIAAANAFSDVYAMGGRPLYALSIVGFPRETLPLSTLTKILEGACEVADEAEAPIVGGHSIDDREPKFGLAVTGIVDPRKVRSNAGGRPGDILVLTKPLGSGVLTTAMKRGLLGKRELREVVRVMRALNRTAGEALAPVAHALTDVTGFGLLGHLRNICANSKLGARIAAAEVPVLAAARRLAAEDVFPGGTRANLAHYGRWVKFAPGIEPAERLLLADAQTNGGLLAAVPRRQLARALDHLAGRTLAAAVIGELVPGRPVIRVE